MKTQLIAKFVHIKHLGTLMILKDGGIELIGLPNTYRKENFYMKLKKKILSSQFKLLQSFTVRFLSIGTSKELKSVLMISSGSYNYFGTIFV
jgi:hypothetical protein